MADDIGILTPTGKEAILLITLNMYYYILTGNFFFSNKKSQIIQMLRHSSC